MIVLFEIVELVATFIEVFVLYRIYGILFQKYRNYKTEKIDFWIAVAAVCVIRVCNHFSAFSYFAMLFFAVYTSVTARFCYKVNYITLLSVASFYLVCLNCFDFLLLSLILICFGHGTLSVELITLGSMIRVLMILVIKSLWVVTYFCVKKYLYIFSAKLSRGYEILVISCIGFLGVVFLANKTIKAFDDRMPGLWFLLVVLLTFCLFLFYYVIENRERKMKLNIVEMRSKLLEDNYKAINNIYMSNAKLYHDLNNHLNVLYQMLEDNNIVSAKQYIEEISKPILKLSKIVWTGIDVVDVVINSKLEKMKEAEIQADINVEFPANVSILPHDMCTILANLLDNAIEAASFAPSPRRISLTIRRINYFVLIKIVNNCTESKDKFADYPVTTKSDKKQHGWGLPSVLDAVEKYNGTFKCEREGNLFTTKIMLFYEKKFKSDGSRRIEHVMPEKNKIIEIQSCFFVYR